MIDLRKNKMLIIDPAKGKCEISGRAADRCSAFSRKCIGRIDNQFMLCAFEAAIVRPMNDVTNFCSNLHRQMVVGPLQTL